MKDFTLDVNGKRYRLNEDFLDGIKRKARGEYSGNYSFDAYWTVARRKNYRDEQWKNLPHEEGDPVLIIETEGPMVPWENLDTLAADMRQPQANPDKSPDESEELDAGNGMKALPPEDIPDTDEIFGRTHFSITPRDFHEVPNPGGDDPDKIPPKPERVGDEPEMVVWIPEHPDIEHRWGAGEAVLSMETHVEWNVQQKANQPNIVKDKPNSHDGFESLCLIHDCEKIGEYSSSNDIPEGDSGSVQRKGKDAFENGRYGGGHWNV